MKTQGFAYSRYNCQMHCSVAAVGRPRLIFTTIVMNDEKMSNTEVKWQTSTQKATYKTGI